LRVSVAALQDEPLFLGGNMNKLLVSSVVVGALVGVVVACNGNDGAVGPAGPGGNNGQGGPGANGDNGSNGVNGANGEAGVQVIVSALAKHGLDISPVPLNVAGLSGDQLEQIGQGSYLVNAVGDCGTCHNDASAPPPVKFLAGGTQFPTGASTYVTARNLTPDPTKGMKLTEAQFLEAFRTGKDFNVPDGGADQALLVMPWQSFRWMSTDDIKAIYAYLKVIPAAVSALPIADNKGTTVPAPVPFADQYDDGQLARPLPPEVDGQGAPVPDPGNVLRGLAVDAIDNAKAIVNLSPSDVGNYGRGAYLVNAIANCSGCHTNPERAGGKVDFAQYMTGGQIFPTPAALQSIVKTTRVMSANLLGPNGFFVAVNLPTFLTAIEQGVHADDPPPQAPLGFPMPARVFRNMVLSDLEAVYTYMRQVATAVPGGRTDKVIRTSAIYCKSDADCSADGGAVAAGPTCDTTNNECVAKSCGSDADCPVCQKCGGGDAGASTCALPAADVLGACIAAGL
jgi:mono/diheme cytochrome c family protein